MAKELPKRSEVRVEDTWKVEDIYANVSLWEADLEKASKLADEAAAYAGKLNTAENVYAAAKLTEDIEYLADRLFNYASRVSDVDTSNTDNQMLVMKVRTVYVGIGEKLSFVEPELLALPEGTIDKFYAEKPELERYRNHTNEILRVKAHVLTPEMEKLLASA